MRLVFVGTHHEPGGAASHFVSLTGAMAAAGHKVAVVASPGGVIWRALEGDGLVTLYAGDFAHKLHRPAMRAVRQAIRDLNPEWIIGAFEIDYWGVALVAAACGVPLVLFLHHAGIKDSSLRVLPWLVRRFLLPSEYLRSWITVRGVSASRTRVLYNPVDTNHFCPNPQLREIQRAALGLTPDDVLVGFVGRLEANKGVVEFAEALTGAMARVPRLRALWVGFGQLEAEVDRIIQRSPYAARHLRRPWTDDPLPYYAAMDVLALPSAGPEAFGRVLVEAQACGVPVLGSAIGGIAEAVDVGTTGRLVPPSDVPAWTDAICELATDRAERTRMGSAGPAFVRRTFDNGVIVESFERLLQSMHTNP